MPTKVETVRIDGLQVSLGAAQRGNQIEAIGFRRMPIKRQRLTVRRPDRIEVFGEPVLTSTNSASNIPSLMILFLDTSLAFSGAI